MYTGSALFIGCRDNQIILAGVFLDRSWEHSDDRIEKRQKNIKQGHEIAILIIGLLTFVYLTKVRKDFDAPWTLVITPWSVPTVWVAAKILFQP